MTKSKGIRAELKAGKREILRRTPVDEKEWVTSPKFLKSREWRELRYEALEINAKTHGKRCVACGRKGGDDVVMNVDHIRPRKYYPHLALVIENLQVLCDDCNAGKGNRFKTDWRQSVPDPPTINIPYTPTEDVIQTVKAIIPNGDIEALVARYEKWRVGMPMADKPHAAFIGWIKKYAEKRKKKS